MTTPTKATGGDIGFSYELQIDIDTAWPASDTPDFTQLAFITNVQPTLNRDMGDTSTYDDRGAKAVTVTGEDWALTFDHQIQRQASGEFITTLQQILNAAQFGGRNKQAQIHVRFYDTEGADYAYDGYAYVSITRTAAGNNDVGGWTVSLTGDGKLTKIANPYIGLTIASIEPTSMGKDDLVTIKGSEFTGATDVTFDGVAATDFVVVDEETIVATIPAGTAGDVPVIVTTSAGATDAFSYTRI